MWLYLDRKLRKMEEGRERYAEILCEKISPYQRIRQFLMSRRDCENTQTISWLTDTTGDEITEILTEMEKSGEVRRVKHINLFYDTVHHYSWEYAWGKGNQE